VNIDYLLEAIPCQYNSVYSQICNTLGTLQAAFAHKVPHKTDFGQTSEAA